ncbi:ABC transporter ATP-binding protein [Halarchaeum nitratireducens]|uniref:ABC-type D-xylose/L-arabinose transporter n=1 Tax=Halarchaeum nitratireducens TaxID=489913 RepID=A0A830GD52_9EURY|nr:MULTISPECIES: sn-glycerol-3-phosphate ABC transporter ATP-binding protein UgpC [Halarchaeum]MBP2250925.1 multiple sugar transport system ATP-binding protein [Halarchaeum solikamskense]GGN19992.1 ABC transporter ATP-binding protein [Halarchaeum nitratireducens]
MARLELDDITKHFDDDGETIVAVDDASIDIDDGEFLVLVGPSGCGKSTTLRMIAGLETITEGELRIGGRRVNEAKPRDRDIAMVFQSYALYPHMTVRENMSFGLEESTDLSEAEITERVESATDTMGISDLLDRKPSELSGGQQQRVALGRAIVREPEVFLMDEPLSNLDAKLRAQMRTELQRLQEDLDTTTVYVTHDQTEAMTMGDRIAILNDGILQQVATPLEAYHAPANQFVAGFIGEPSMNFFDVDLEGDSVVGDGLDYPVSDDVRAKLDTDALVLGIRPQDIELVDAVESGHDVAVTVDVVEPMGDENNVYLTFSDTAGNETFIANVDGRTLVDEGDDIVARIPEEAVHFFDRRSGEALRNREFDGDADVDLSL